MQPSAAPTTSGQALTNLQGAQSQAKAPQDILSGQQQQLGVPGQQQQVSGLRQAITNTTNLLNQVAPSVYGRTQNSLVTSAQAGHQIANEQAPIATQLQQENQDYSGAQSDLDKALTLAGQSANLEVAGQQQKLDNFKSIYDSLYKQEQDAATRELENQKLSESKRQFDVTNATNQANKLNLADLLKTTTPAATTPSLQDQAYQNVQGFLKGDNNSIRSDYAATLKSANNGNALDKLKIQLYQSARPDLFGPTPALLNTPGLSTSGGVGGLTWANGANISGLSF